MNALDQGLLWAQVVVWCVLAIAAIAVWRAHRTRAAAWLASTFIVLAGTVFASRFFPDEPEAFDWGVKLLVAGLVIFPYLLWRFVLSLVERRPWAWWTGNALTVAVLLATAVTAKLPADSANWGPWAWFYVLLFITQWLFLLGRVGILLWRGAYGQPGIAGRRMRAMSIAGFALTALLIVSTFAPTSAPIGIAMHLMTLLVGPLFLIGFAPPRFVRVLWRAREQSALRRIEVDLVRAQSRAQIAAELLPRALEVLGGRAAVLLDTDGSVLASEAMDDTTLAEIRAALSSLDEPYTPQAAGLSFVCRMDHGFLAVTVGPLTPFFGTEELRMIAALAAFTDLALGRAALLESEARAREAMREFVAVASHDLRTPVTVIQGFADLLEDEHGRLTETDRREYVGVIARQVRRLDRLVGDLLTVSRLDVNEIEPVCGPVNVTRLAAEVCATVAPEAAVEVSGPDDAVAHADADHVARMLQNYLANAMAYGAEPIGITTAIEDGRVLVRVHDCGPGVPRDFVDQLFGKFARADKSSVTSTQGTGLGLSIVRGLARANGGEAWYEADGPGATFVFALPHEPSRRLDAVLAS